MLSTIYLSARLKTLPRRSVRTYIGTKTLRNIIPNEQAENIRLQTCVSLRLLQPSNVAWIRFRYRVQLVRINELGITSDNIRVVRSSVRSRLTPSIVIFCVT